jgi:hypothetical protein
MLCKKTNLITFDWLQNCFWPSPAQWFVVQSPTGLMAIFTGWRGALTLCQSLSKYFPSAHTHLLQRSCHCWKHLWKSSSGMALRPAVALYCISSAEAKWWPVSPILSLGKSRKSHGARSGEYGGWVTVWIWFFSKKCCTVREVCQGALSWCRIRLFLRGRLWHTSIS